MFWGEKDTRAPEGAPVALRATGWAAPLVTAVEMVLVVPEPAVTVAEVGAAEIEKSGGGGWGAPALNRAMPAAQYMADENVPAKLWGVAEFRSRYPLTRVALLGALVVCCGSTANPDEETLIACVLA